MSPLVGMFVSPLNTNDGFYFSRTPDRDFHCFYPCENIDLSDVTNRYYTVLYGTVVEYEKKNRSLVISGSRKFPTLGSTVQWETR